MVPWLLVARRGVPTSDEKGPQRILLGTEVAGQGIAV